MAPRPAAAAITAVFDTVDAVELSSEYIPGVGSGLAIKVTGVLAGGSTPTTLTFGFGGSNSEEVRAQCARLAAVAMSKPGKYQFGIGSTDSSGLNGGCKLILRTP